MTNKSYDVVIVGGGITGTAIVYTLSHFTNVERIALVEKYATVAQGSSHYTNNSQTLHFGDIETHYTPEKAEQVKANTTVTAHYLEKYAPHAFRKYPKMALAVGEEEVAELREHYNTIQHLFPRLQLIGRDEIAAIEPLVVEGRDSDEPLLAMYTPDGYTVDWEQQSQSFVDHARQSDTTIDLFFDTKAQRLEKPDEWYRIHTETEMLEAKTVVVATGAHSLYFAQKLGYGDHLILLPVAGDFFCTCRKLLNGKVYTMQIKELPFAAIHGDPDVHDPDNTVFGPTAKVLPLLERHNYESFWDFMKLFRLRWRAITSLTNIVSDWTIFKYILQNIVYDMPFIKRHAFLPNVQKIVPTARAGDLVVDKGRGGIRPQIVDINKKELAMGEAKIHGDNIIFNITPSPGASICLANAENDVAQLIDYLGDSYYFDKERFHKEFREKQYEELDTLQHHTH